MIDHITEAQNPIRGKATIATGPGPNRAQLRVTIAAAAKPIKIRRLSKSFSRTRPSRQPAVIRPQNRETVEAPLVWGSTPWKVARNFEIQLAAPCSAPPQA